MIGQAKTYAWRVLALLLAGLLLWQSLRASSAEVAQFKAEKALSMHVAAQAKASEAETIKKASALLTHAGAQQDNAHDYTETLQRLEVARAADADRIAGLQHDIRAAATRHAQLAGDAAACRNLTNQHEQLAAHTAEGAALVGELADLVRQRDGQVKALLGQVMVDGMLIKR